MKCLKLFSGNCSFQRDTNEQTCLDFARSKKTKLRKRIGPTNSKTDFPTLNEEEEIFSVGGERVAEHDIVRHRDHIAARHCVTDGRLIRSGLPQQLQHEHRGRKALSAAGANDLQNLRNLHRLKSGRTK